MSTGLTQGPTWGTGAIGSGNALADLGLNVFASSNNLRLNNFWGGRENSNDNAEAQGWNRMTMHGAAKAAVETGAGAQVSKFVQGGNKIAQSWGLGSVFNSPTSADALGQKANEMMPMAQQFGGAVFDAVGMGGPGYHRMVAQTQRGFMDRNLSPDQIKAAGEKMAETTVGAYNILQRGDQMQNVSGYGMGEAGGITATAQRLGLGGVGKFSKPDSDKRLAKSTIDATMQARAVQDLGGQFSNMSGEEALGQVKNLTMGGSGMTAEQRTMHIRETQQLSRLGGVSVEQAAGMQIQAGQYAQQMGGDVRQGRAAMKRGLAERSHYQQLSDTGLAAAHTDVDALTQKSAMLTAGAMNSTVGGQMASLMDVGKQGLLDKKSKGYQQYLNLRGKDALGDITKKGDELMAAAKKDPKAAETDEYKAFTASADYRDYKNIKGGMGAKGDYKYMKEAEYTKMLASSGMSKEEAQASRMNTKANIKEHGESISNQARNEQWDVDIKPELTKVVGGALSQLTRGKLKGKRGEATAAAAVEALHASAGEDRDTTISNIEKAMVKKGIGVNRKQAHGIASSIMGTMDTSMKDKQYENAQEAALLHSDTMKSDTAATNKTAKDQAASDQKHRGKGHAGLAQRVFKGVSSGDPDELARQVANAEPIEPGPSAPPDPTSGAAGPAGGAATPGPVVAKPGPAPAAKPDPSAVAGGAAWGTPSSAGRPSSYGAVPGKDPKSSTAAGGKGPTLGEIAAADPTPYRRDWGTPVTAAPMGTPGGGGSGGLTAGGPSSAPIRVTIVADPSSVLAVSITERTPNHDIAGGAGIGGSGSNVGSIA